MSSIASLGRMTSGLRAAQTGLQVTGHNIANVNTKGYTRQQALQHDSSYLTVGSNGGRLQQVGLGVSISEIRQVRDEFADKRYRTENSVLNFYTAKQSATAEIEAILDEPHGAAMSGMMEDFWKQMQKLSTNPAGVEERLAFIQTADVLMKRANQIMDGFNSYQYDLNVQIKDSVNHINSMLHQIKDLNESISYGEINGDNANDLRDQRNVLLDELSSYIDIDYYEDKDGKVVVKTEGRNLIDGPFVIEMDLRVSDKGATGFVIPTWSDTDKDVYSLDHIMSSTTGEDTGKLKGLLIARGETTGSMDTSWDDIALNPNYSVDKPGNSYIIPKVQKQLNELIHELTVMVNDTLDGMGMGDHKGMVGVPVFIPKNTTNGQPLPDYPKAPQLEDFVDDATSTAAEKYEAAMEKYKADMEAYKEAIKPHLVAGNIQVNPELTQDGGYNKLGTVSGDPNNVGDNSVVTELLSKWSQAREWPRDGKGLASAPNTKHSDFMDFYSEMVASVGAEGSEYKGKIREKSALVTTVDNERMAMGAVSQDEELSNMLKYQYAYNAAARMVNVLDGMMDTIINRM